MWVAGRVRELASSCDCARNHQQAAPAQTKSDTVKGCRSNGAPTRYSVRNSDIVRVVSLDDQCNARIKPSIQFLQLLFIPGRGDLNRNTARHEK